MTALKASLVLLKDKNLIRDRWDAWMTSDTGLKALHAEIPAYFKADVWERFKRSVGFYIYIYIYIYIYRIVS